MFHATVSHTMLFLSDIIDIREAAIEWKDSQMVEEEFMNDPAREPGNPTEFLGIVFDIKEFALFDGPGLRCTVFMKGCPLRCSWCHNPEGLKPVPEMLRTDAGSRHVGLAYTVGGMVEKLLAYRSVFAGTDGGITFSGGEPLMQPDFVVNVMRKLKGKMHLLLQTSGFCSRSVFLSAIGQTDMVYFDFKLANPGLHLLFTRQDNADILDNLLELDRSGVEYRLRLPLVPDVTDTAENYEGIRKFIKENLHSAALTGIDLLPYNRAAGGKYAAVGRRFNPGFDETKEVSVRPDYFKDIVKEVMVL